eukprot:2182178-Rhodomonas_salina.2
MQLRDTPGRHTGESGMLAWVHSTLEESVETMEGLHDGAIFSRLLDRLFQSSFPLEKVVHGARGEGIVKNYKVIQGFLVARKIKYQPDFRNVASISILPKPDAALIPLYMTGSPMGTCAQWLKQKYEEGAEESRQPREAMAWDTDSQAFGVSESRTVRPGKFVFDPEAPYRSKERQRVMKQRSLTSTSRLSLTSPSTTSRSSLAVAASSSS